MTIYHALFILVFYLSVTLLIEIAVAALLGYRNKNFLIVVGLASVVTNPVLTVLITLYSYFLHTHIPLQIIIILEVLIIVIEYFILLYVYKSKYSKKELLMVSTIINSSSFVIGFFIQTIYIIY